jgi:hypothetical protein
LQVNRARRRLAILVLSLPVLLVVLAFLYMGLMYYLEGETRNFLDSFEWAAETLTTTGYAHRHVDQRAVHELLQALAVRLARLQQAKAQLGSGLPSELCDLVESTIKVEVLPRWTRKTT